MIWINGRFSTRTWHEYPANHQNCRSFRHLVKAFGELAPACGLNLENWPPPKWHEA